MASEKVEKKRKRDSERHDRPSKKPAVEAHNLPQLAASVLKDDSEFAPVLGTYCDNQDAFSSAIGRYQVTKAGN